MSSLPIPLSALQPDAGVSFVFIFAVIIMAVGMLVTFVLIFKALSKSSRMGPPPQARRGSPPPEGSAGRECSYCGHRSAGGDTCSECGATL